MANRISIKFREQIWVAKQSSWVVQNFRICALAGWKSHHRNAVAQERVVIWTLNLVKTSSMCATRMTHFLYQ